MSRRSTIAGALTTAILGLGLIFAPIASAQASGLHATDRAGDARGANGVVPSANQPALDILAADVRVGADTITFVTRVATAPAPVQLAANTYDVSIQAGYYPFTDQDNGGFYDLNLLTSHVQGDRATLNRFPDVTGAVTVNTSTNEVVATYPRATIDAYLADRGITLEGQAVLYEVVTSGPYTQTGLLGTRSGTAQDTISTPTPGTL